MVAVWVALAASGLALAFAARGAGPLPGDLALSRLIQQPPPVGGAWLIIYDSPPPLVGLQRDGSRRSYEKKKASAAMT
jgi:hypothetical protein